MFETKTIWLVTYSTSLMHYIFNCLICVKIYSQNVIKCEGKNGYKFIFQGSTSNAFEIVKVSLSWARQFLFVHKDSPPGRCIGIQDQSLSRNFVYLHIDDARNVSTGFVSVGGVLWNQFGDWIIDFNHTFGNCSVFDIELWTTWDGLLLLQKGSMIGFWFKQIAWK